MGNLFNEVVYACIDVICSKLLKQGRLNTGKSRDKTFIIVGEIRIEIRFDIVSGDFSIN